MSYRATTVTNVSYSDSDSLTFDQAPGTAPLAAGVAVFYPQSAMYNPILKSQLQVIATLGTPSGQTVAAEISSNPSSRTIANGDIVEMAPGADSDVWHVYASVSAPIQAMIDAASAVGTAAGRVVKVTVHGAGAIAAALTAASNVHLVTDGCSLTFLSVGTSSAVINFTGTGSLVGAGTFTGTVTKNANGATLTSGGSSLTAGDLCSIFLTANGLVRQMVEVSSIVTNAVKFKTSFARPYTTGYQLSRVTSLLENFTFEGAITNAVGNATANAIDVNLCRNFRVTNSDIAEAVVIENSYQVTVDNTIIRHDQTSFNALDIRSCSVVLVQGCRIFVPAAESSLRVYDSTDYKLIGNDWGLGGRLEVHDNSCRGYSAGNFSSNGDGALGTGLTFANSDAAAIEVNTLSPGDVVVEGGHYHNSFQNAVFFAASAWHDVTVRDCDFTSVTGGASSVCVMFEAAAVATNVHLINCKRDSGSTALTINSGSTVYIWDDTWLTWATPTLTQSGTVSTVTVALSEYRWRGSTIEFQIALTLTGGTGAVGANDVEVALPVAMATAWQSNGAVLGSGYVYDSSVTTRYIGTVDAGSTTSRCRIAALGAGFLGSVTFTDALANGDLVKVAGEYKTAFA